MPANFPATLPALATNKADATTTATDHKDHHNQLAFEVNAIGTAVGAGVTNGRIKVVQEAPLNVNWPDYAGNITSALAAVPATGGRIYIPGQAAAYTTAANLAVPSKTEVFGDGEATRVVRSGATTGKVFVNSDIVAGNTDITIRDLTVDRTASVDGLDPHDNAIHFRHVTRGRVADCHVKGATKGIHFQGCIQSMIHGCMVDSFWDNGIAINDPTGVGDASPADAQVSITNCIVNQTAATLAAAGSSLVIVSSEYVQVKDCQLKTTTALSGHGLELGVSGAFEPGDCRFEGNILIGCSILIGAGIENVIKDNTLVDGTVGSSARIYVVGTGGGTPSRTQVVGNNVRAAGTGFNAIDVHGDFSVICDNHLRGGARMIVDADDCEIIDNIVEGSVREGINVQSCSRPTIQGNRARNCGTESGGAATDKVGFVFDTLTSPVILNNVAQSSLGTPNFMQYGYYINASTGITWRDNRSRGHNTGNVTTTGTQSWERGQIVPTIASAATVLLPDYADLVVISGTTNITSVTATGQTGRLVQMKFDNALTVVNGSNLLLVGGDFRTATDAVLTLVCSGGNWHEVSRTEARGVRLPARVAAPVNITVSGPGATIDGVTMAAGDRMLLANQTTASQNGLYIWNGAAVAATRSGDADSAAKLTDSLLVTVDEGTINKDSIWTLSTNKPITVGTTALRFTRIHPAAVAVSQPSGIYFAPGSAKLENMPRAQGGFANTAMLTTQIIRVFPLGALRAGDTLAALNFRVATTASAGITNSWAGIARLSDRVVLAVSATSTATTAAQGLKTFTFTSAYTADKDELLVGFVMYQATTVPTFHGITHGDASIIADVPVMNGASNTGQTTPIAVAATMTAFTAAATIPYVYAT